MRKASWPASTYDPQLPDVEYEVLEYAREHCPVAHSTGQGGYHLVTRYADVSAVLLDDATYSSTRGKALPPRQALPMPPIDLDPPLQTEFRRLLNRYFSRSRLARHTDAIRDICARAAEPWLSAGSCDLSADYANKITAEVLALVVLGLDDVAEVQQAQHLVDAIAGANAAQAWQSLQDYVDRLLRRRAEHPDGSDDVLTAILTGTVAGRPLTEDERRGTVTVLMLGGLDTTKGALGNILHHVTRRPGLEQRLRDPGWVRSDLDEFLRLDTPVTAMARYVTRDTQLAGQPLRAGEWVMLHFGSANRDRRVFDHPDDLDLARTRAPHLAFGTGVHHCLGVNLARLTITIAIQELLARVRNIQLIAGAYVRLCSGLVRYPESLPVTFEPMP